MGEARKYLLLLSHFSDLTLGNYQVDPACSEHAQNHFIAQRKKEADFLKS